MIDIEKLNRVTSLGGGPIGAGWTAHFLARGYDVCAYLHDDTERDAFLAILDTAWMSLETLGLADGASRDRLSIETQLGRAVENAEFSQESAPERLELKQDLSLIHI